MLLDLTRGKAQPRTHYCLDRGELLRIELAQRAKEFDMRNGDEVLGVERAGFQEADGNCHFKSRTPDAGGMGNEGGKRPILVRSGYTENQRRSNLSGHAQIDEPDLAALRCDHWDCSRRSNS